MTLVGPVLTAAFLFLRELKSPDCGRPPIPPQIMQICLTSIIQMYILVTAGGKTDFLAGAKYFVIHLS
jgi:hypothetical protein